MSIGCSANLAANTGVLLETSSTESMFPKELLQFKEKVEAELARIDRELQQIRQQLDELEKEKAQLTIQAASPGDDRIDQQLQRLQELQMIFLDHKERLSAEILRIGNRNPGLLRPEFD